MEPSGPKNAPAAGARPKNLVLRFISGKYQGGEFPLPQTGEIVIGRSSELDMVLVEDMVSRRHAKISIAADQIFIQDLGSTNGTFVNGEKIKRTKLNEGDRILIGTSIIKLVSSDVSTSPGRARFEETANAKRSSQVRTMTGSIAEVPLPDLLQLFGASKKSGVLVVRTDTDTGKIFLDKGRVVFACVNENFEIPPVKSIFRILMWDAGTFDMEPPEEREFPATIDMSTEGLLMEGMRQLDEMRRIASELPPASAALVLDTPFQTPLRDLQPRELDVLELVLNWPTYGGALDHSTLTDFETAEVIAKLLRSKYLRVG